MKQEKLRSRMVMWTKEQRAARQEEMEELHPGYLDMQLRLNVMLGATLFARGFFHALSIMVGQEPVYYVILAPISLLIGFGMYSVCMQNWGLAGLFLAFRFFELFKSLRSTLPYVFYLNFIGTVWWVTLVACLLMDIVFLWCLTLTRKGRQQVKYNQIVSSGQVINLRKAAMRSAADLGAREGLEEDPDQSLEEHSGQNPEEHPGQSREDNGQQGEE